MPVPEPMPRAGRARCNLAAPPWPGLAAALLLPGAVSAAFVGDTDNFAVNVQSDGTFGQIYLAGQIFSGDPDENNYYGAQYQTINGKELVNGGNVDGDDPTSSVSYTAEILNDAGDAADFFVAVLTYILGPLADANGGFGTQSMFRQEFTITNVSGTAQTLASVSYLLPDFYEAELDDAYDETATADAATGVAYATDANTPRFIAMVANADGYDMAWNVGLFGDLPDPTTFADLNNATGPVSELGTGVEMATGLMVPWTLAPGAAATLRFSYFVSMDQQTPPPSFAPAPATAALLLPGLALVGALRRRGRRAAAR